MKLNRIITLCAVAATLALSAGTIFAQQDNGGDNGGQRRNRQGGGPGGPGGNWDPAQMQQRMLDRIKTDLNFTNDTEWSAVQPLVQKVIDARFAARSGMFGGGRGGRGPGGPGGPGAGQSNPERDALQKAIDDNSPAAQVKDLLTKYRASQKAKQAKLTEAQDALRQVLSSTQEAQAVLAGLLD